MADQLEPRREKQAGVVEHGLELVGSNILHISGLVEVRLQIDVGLDEEDVVNWNCDVSCACSQISGQADVNVLSCSPHFPSPHGAL